MIIILPLFFIAICYLIGITVVSAVKSENNLFVRSHVYLPVFIGYSVLLVILHSIGLAVPINILTALTLAILIVLAAKYRTVIAELTKNYVKENSFLIIALLIPLFVVGMPQLVHGELFTDCGGNNDFAYYLASIQWLKDHTILSEIFYNHIYPEYSLAQYMISYTRIGVDLTGAFIANVFRLDSYQVFPILCSFASSMVYMVICTTVSFFTGNNKLSAYIAIYGATSLTVVHLILQQYPPQILGCVYLVLVAISFAHMYEGKNIRGSILCGLFVSSIFALYHEFTVYLVLMLLILIVSGFAMRKLKISQVFIAALFSICYNPYSFGKTLKFNLDILNRVTSGGAAAIDPYGGNLFPKKNLLRFLFGIDGIGNSDNKLIVYVALAMLIACVGCFIYLIYEKQYTAAVFVISIEFPFAILELYFRQSRGGYQEFKGITSMGIVTMSVMALLYCYAALNASNTKKLISLLLKSFFVLLFIVTCRIELPGYINSAFTIDSDTMSLKEAAMLIPYGEDIEIDNVLTPLDYMGAVYALRDRPVNLSSNNPSYLNSFQTFEDDKSRYVVYTADKYSELAVDKTYNVLWANEKYCLVEDLDEEKSQRFNFDHAGGWQYGNNLILDTSSSTLAKYYPEDTLMISGPNISMPTGDYCLTVKYSGQGTGDDIANLSIVTSDGSIVSDSLQSGSSVTTTQPFHLTESSPLNFSISTVNNSTLQIDEISIKEVS